MLRRFGVLFLAHCAILAVWFGVARPRPTVVDEELAGVGPVQHTYCRSENGAFVTIHLFLGAAIALWTLYIAASLRNIRAEFNESASIGVSMAVLGAVATWQAWPHPAPTVTTAPATHLQRAPLCPAGGFSRP